LWWDRGTEKRREPIIFAFDVFEQLIPSLVHLVFLYRIYFNIYKMFLNLNFFHDYMRLALNCTKINLLVGLIFFVIFLFKPLFMAITNSLFDLSFFSKKRIRKGAVKNASNLAFQNHIPVNNVKPTKEAERQS